MDPPSCSKYRFNHCFPNTATSAARSEIRRLANKRTAAADTPAVEGCFWTHDEAMVAFDTADSLRARRVSRRIATDWSLGCN